MSVQILTDEDLGYQCLMCSTTMMVFGGIFYESEDVEAFLEWLPMDARKYEEVELLNKISEWRNEM